MNYQNVRRQFVRLVVASLATGLVAIAGANPVSAAKVGDECKSKDLYKIEKVGSSFIRCEIVKGTSIHATEKSKKAKFKWTVTKESQYILANAENETIQLDGSSTVYPLAAVAAKYFENSTKGVKKSKGAKVTVGFSGTGGGFEKFCRNETDISNASRAIKASEAAACAKTGITYTEVIVANDGIAVVVNPSNTWASCLTMKEMNAIWKDGSTITNWKDVRAGFPDQALTLFGAGTDSGTFDSFTEFVNHKSKSVRKTGVQTSEDDNVTVKGVSSDKGAMGYFGLSYAEENANKVKLISLDKGAGCVEPTVATVQNVSYPMARPLYFYVKNASIATKPAVGAFVQFWVDNLAQISEDAIFVPLTKAQIKALQGGIKAIALIPKVKK